MRSISRFIACWLLNAACAGAVLPLLAANPPPTAAPNDQNDPAVASDGVNFFVVWTDRRETLDFDIYGARVSATGEVLDPGGIPICTAREYQLFPSVAFDGANYLVVWSDARDHTVENPRLDIYGARVSPGGVVLDPDGIQITHGEVAYQPDVAFNGADCLVTSFAWEHNGQRGTIVLGVRVTPTGVVRDQEELVLHTAGFASAYPALVASLGDDWLVVWGSGYAEAVRVARNGSVSSPVRILDRSSIWVHGLAAVGTNYFLGSVASRPIAEDTHVVDVFGTWITPEGRPRNTILVAANTNRTIGSYLQPTTYFQERPAVAGSGSGVLVVWEAGNIYTNGGNSAFLSDIRGARVDLNDSVSPVISICNAPQDQSYSAVAFNGQHFLAVWHDGRTAPPDAYTANPFFDIYGARLTTAGTVLETNGFLISGTIAPPDDDNDGVPNDRDRCPGTPPGTAVDSNGCPSPDCTLVSQRQQTFGRAGVNGLRDVKQLRDGSYVAVGAIAPAEGGFGAEDAYLVRFDARGQMLSDRTMGSVFYDNFASLAPLNDGGFLVAGTTGTEIDKADIEVGWLLRFDADGRKLWEKKIGGRNRDEYQFHDIQTTRNGGFVVGGRVDTDEGLLGYVARFNSRGRMLWERRIGPEAYITQTYLTRILVLPDGGVLAGGTSQNDGDYDVWLTRLDAMGAIEWERSFPLSGFEIFHALLPTVDGGFLIGCSSSSSEEPGKTSPNLGFVDYWVVRVDSEGNQLWDRSFGGSSQEDLIDLAYAPNGGFYLGGVSSSPPSGNKSSPNFGGAGYDDYWLVHIDANGQKVSEQTFGGLTSDYLQALEPTKDGGLLLAGSSDSDVGGNKTAPRRNTFDFWVVKLGNGCDQDGDGVADDRDQCPNTPSGAVVNAQGCSIAQLCPCDGPWRNHGEYVVCVLARAWEFYRQGLIDKDQRKAMVREAVRSDCGENGSRELVCIHFCPQTSEESRRDGIRVVLSGDTGAAYVIESSSDLINWAPVETGEATVVGDEILFPISPDVRARFYRVRLSGDEP